MTTYYVDITSGSDADSGLSEALAWQTFAKTQSAPIAAGDLVYVKGSATYTTRLNITVVGTATAPIVFEGYTTTPGDGGMVTVTDTVNNTGLTPAAGGNFYVIKNFRFTGMSGVGAGNPTSDSFTYKHCRFDTNGGDGVQGDQDCRFEGCYAHDNTGDGFDIGALSIFMCCIAWNNTIHGYQAEGGVWYKCLAYSNGSIGFSAITTGPTVFIGCLAEGHAEDTTTGFDLNTAGSIVPTVIDCIAYDCGTGMAGNTASATERSFSRNNLVNDCTTAYTSFQTWTGALTSAPSFVAEDSDYTPAAASPLIAAGYSLKSDGWVTVTGDHSDIGPITPVISTDFPAVADVQSGVSYKDGTLTGTFTEPGVGNVETGVTYGGGGTEFTGTFARPAVGEVKTGIGYGAGGTEFTGTRTHPAVGEVKTGIQYGSGGTEFTGTRTVPAVGDVESPNQFGAGGTEFTGTLTLPVITDVRDTIQYGAGGTEFTGSLVAGAGGASGLKSGGGM